MLKLDTPSRQKTDGCGHAPDVLRGNVPCIVEQYMRRIVRDYLLRLAVECFALCCIEFGRRVLKQHIQVRVGIKTKIRSLRRHWSLR